MIGQKQRRGGGETVDSDNETKRRNDDKINTDNPNKTLEISRVTSNERTERFGENLLSNPVLRKSNEQSIRTTGMSSKKQEKTMLKVMDPNVHQMVLNTDEINQ